jgi:hypothetical protein
MSNQSRVVRLVAGAVAAVVCAFASRASASETKSPAPPAHPVISYVKVLSNNIPDVSSLEAWRKSFITDSMSEKEKALAVWRSSVMFRHQDAPPLEFVASDRAVYDPIQSFNVYGYGMCSCASAHVEALSRYVGLAARGWGITGHSVPEVRIGGNWSMLDSSLINYFQKPNGSIAGVEEAHQSIVDWYATHADFRGNDTKLRDFMRGDGWRNGPAVVACGTGYDSNGWLPAATHGWYSTMEEFGGKGNFLYEYGSAVGYEVNVQLRPGERLTRNWSNKGLHINMDGGGDPPGCLNLPVGTENLRYSPQYGDIAPGRIGNGTLEYELPLASGAFRDAMLVADNLAASSEDGQQPAAHVKDSAQPAVLVFRMRSSYVYLGGELSFTPVLGDGGSVSVEFSDNNGLDWKQIGGADGASAKGNAQTVDLKPFIFRRYDYRLRFTLRGKATGLDAVKVVHDVQHSQRPLPALAAGDNRITFSAGPSEGTITINPNTNPENKGKNLFYTDFHPTVDSMEGPNLRVTGGLGQITFPIETPGDMTRLRIGAHYRARDARDGFAVETSFDNGKTWRPVGTLEGPYAGNSKYFVFSDVPANSRAALVRLSGTQRNTTLILDLRIDADYREPHGGFAPVKVTYRWKEEGHEKQDIHIARAADEAYAIHCAQKPVMESIIVEQE